MTADDPNGEGIEHAERGDLDRALECFERDGSRAALVNAGRALRELERPQEARERFAAAADAGDAEALVDLGNLLDDHLADAVGAVEAFERAAAAGNADGAINLGVLRRRDGRLDDAERAFELAQRLGSAHAGSYLGELRLERGDREGARAAYEAAARTRPEALTDWGAALARAGDRAAAETIVRRALPHDPEAVTLLGHLLVEDGRTAEAETLLRRHLESPAGPDARLDLANLLAEDGRFSEALALLATGVERGDAQAFANLGAIHKAMGDLAAAERHYRKGAAAGDDIARVGLANLLLDRNARDEAVMHLTAADSEDARRLLKWLEGEAPAGGVRADTVE